MSEPAVISPAFAFLLNCVTSAPDGASIRKSIEEGMDWALLLQLAQEQGVRPLLRRSLKATCWTDVPQDIRTKLDLFHREHAERCLFIARELVRVCDAFREKNIPVATFKGVALAYSIYGDLSLRELCDLDILIHENDLIAAEQILKQLGYEAVVSDESYRSAFLRYQGQYLFRLNQTGMLIDLHWALASNGFASPLFSQNIWQRLTTWRLAERNILTLSWEDEALFLATHGTKEGWRFLMWVADFAEFVRKHQNLDWVSLFRRAERSHCVRPLLLAVLLCYELLKAPVSPHLLAVARKNAAVRSLAGKSRSRILQQSSHGELDEFINALMTYDRWTDRIRPVLALLTTRTVSDFKTMPLPKAWWLLYYLTRPLRLAMKLSHKILSNRPSA